jgi:hypothetical protein
MVKIKPYRHLEEPTISLYSRCVFAFEQRVTTVLLFLGEDRHLKNIRSLLSPDELDDSLTESNDEHICLTMSDFIELSLTEHTTSSFWKDTETHFPDSRRFGSNHKITFYVLLSIPKA